MKKITLTLLLSIFTTTLFAQQAYYNDVDLTLRGQDLYFELQDKIDINNNTYTYGDVRDTFLTTDENPDATNDVLLIYGFQNDGNCTTDRSRDKDDFGGSTCEYNREHVFARSNANPSMGSVNNASTGIGADPHNLRPSDQQMNGNKGSRRFADGSGNAGVVSGGNWFPGEEWKGDVARMMMYMYTRYGDRCLPSLNGAGATQSGTDMLQVYLQWNVDDPVNDYEDQRNPILEVIYGNRNPFIDNPALATAIWGGPQAEDRWGNLGTDEVNTLDFVLYPNPATEKVWFQSHTATNDAVITIYDISGKIMFSDQIENAANSIDISSLQAGIYIVEVINSESNFTSRLLVE